jgi:Na+/proline symporter
MPGVIGFLLAGLLAAFMSNFAATLNAAPAYIVNDIYLRFLNPNLNAKAQVRMSRFASLAVLIIGMTVGLLIDRIDAVMQWIVGALYGGYVLANVLKWIWWRFNGYGYFWGLMSGIVSSLVFPLAAKKLLYPDINSFYVFPVIFFFSAVGCFMGTLLSKPEDDAILMKFYKTVRPWGFWGPIRDKVMREDHEFQPNRDFRRDMVNVMVGIVWQLCLTALPIFLVLRNWPWALSILAVLAVTSIFLKYKWFDKLEKA